MKVVSTAKKMGVYTIVTDISANKKVAEIADEVLPYSVTDIDALYEWCQSHPVDGVLNHCIDYSQHTHQVLCEKLGFPCFGTAEQYLTLTDKSAFKELCIFNGVDIIPEYNENAIDNIEFPVLVKPAESSGSRGLSICHSKNELNDVVENAREVSRNGKVIIEKYMGGKQDFTVTFLVIEGHPYLIRVGDRYLGKIEDGLDRQCICTISPSVNLSMYLEHAHNSVVNMLKTLGIQNGPVFLQGFIDGDKFRFYDPGIRFPGGEYDRLLLVATGIDVMKAVIGFALTGRMLLEKPIDEAYLLNGKTAVQLTITARAGTICEYSGFDEIERMSEVVYVARKAKVGTVIPASGDVKQRVVEIDFLVDNYDEVKTISNQIYSKLSILDEYGESMIVSRFDS